MNNLEAMLEKQKALLKSDIIQKTPDGGEKIKKKVSTKAIL
jgi:hypothetical protein